MKQIQHKSWSKRDSAVVRGFTLVEMMVVVAMIALIVTAMAPMVFSTIVSTRLTSAGETLAGQISLAHQLAVSSNQTVEVRFYQYDDPETPGSGTGYKAVAIMRASASGGLVAQGVNMVQLTDTFYLPSGIVIGDSSQMSPMFASGSTSAKVDAERIIKRAATAKYKAFRFNPDGTSNLESLMGGAYRPNLSYLTLAEERIVDTEKTIPKNFFAIQVDPTTGRTTTYRP